MLDSAAEGVFYNQVDRGVLRLGAVDPYATWIRGLIPETENATRAFRDRVMNELLDTGTLDEMNTVLRRWGLLLRPTVGIDLTPNLTVLPAYPILSSAWRSDGPYPPLRLPGAAADADNTASGAAPRPHGSRTSGCITCRCQWRCRTGRTRPAPTPTG